MELSNAIALVKKYVKMSAIENQNHIDLTLVDSKERPEVEKALAALKMYVKKGDITEAELNQDLGLK